jgi:MFS family permease
MQLKTISHNDRQIFLAAIDQTIIVASYGKIGSELNALNLTSWIATSYFLTLTSFQPLYGRLSDIFGRKSCLIFAYVVFGAGGLFCGLAQNINQLIAGRVRLFAITSPTFSFR